MKFGCPKCKTRYSIANEKVPAGKTVKFTCKKCSNVIRLRRKASSSDQKPAPAAQAPPFESTRVASVHEIEALKSDAASAPKPSGGMDSGVTRVASIEEFEALRKQDEAAAVQDDDEWFVLLGEEQRGPYDTAKMRALLAENEIDRRSYVWRDGMDDWQRLGDVDAFTGDADDAGDAHWRVVAPATPDADAAPEPELPSPDFGGESTVAMDVEQLREQLAKAKVGAAAAAASPPAPPADEDAETVIGEPGELRPSRIEVQPNVDDEFDSAFEDSYEGVDPDPGFEATPPPDPPLSRTEDESEDLPDVTDEVLDDDGSDPDTRSAVSALAIGYAGRGDRQATHSRVEAPEFVSDRDDELPEHQPAADPLGPPLEKMVPGEATRVVMATAGIYRRRHMHRVAALVGIAALMAVAVIVAADIMGVLKIPGMGVFYDMTGLIDPNTDRAVDRVQRKLQRSELEPKERRRLEELRKQLIGKPAPRKSPQHKQKAVAATTTEGVRDTRDLSKKERNLAESIMSDTRKKTGKLELDEPDAATATVDLPQGLTQEAITKVITENSRAMALCTDEAMRKGEKLEGRMEIEFTIAPIGDVLEAAVRSPQFANSTMAACTIRRVKNWKFPRFNGDPVTVTYPYILQMSF